jgi:hypothetical protein
MWTNIFKIHCTLKILWPCLTISGDFLYCAHKMVAIVLVVVVTAAAVVVVVVVVLAFNATVIN